MRLLSWNEFNDCIESITDSCLNTKFSGVYGFPRGGICLAVALSHSLNIPFLLEPRPGSLIVDDVYEGGSTLEGVKDIPQITAFVWLSKKEPLWWQAYETTKSNEWLVFPWENKQYAHEDFKSYLLSKAK